MECTLDVQKKAHGHKGGVQAKDLRKMEARGSSGPLQMWHGTETWEVSMFKEAPGRGQKGSQ